MVRIKGSFIICLFIILNSTVAKSQTENIKIDQVGFLTKGKKIAIYTGSVRKDAFYILDNQSKDTVFKGSFGAPKRSAYSSLTCQVADFSSLTKKGVFFLSTDAGEQSYSFRISDDVYDAAGAALLKGFYFIRSNQALEPLFAGKWSRPAGHPDTVVYIHASAATKSRPEGFRISSPGGWYDAGDYNKYIVNSGITMGTLLSAYEDFPVYFSKQHVGIPESSDKVPDILNEAIYNLRWMMTMQDPEDGGVYHKCTNAAFDGMVMPGATKLPRYVVQKSTAATLDFTAVMAQMSRIAVKFKKLLPGLSDSCRQAAERAWSWATRNPDSLYDQRKLNEHFNPQITTGDYGDRSLKDEWFWAASEMLITTGNQLYYDTLLRYLNSRADIPSWNNVAMMGYYSLAAHGTQLPSFARSNINRIKDSIINKADHLIRSKNDNAFQTVMGQSSRDFIWGSSSVAANQGMLLIKAYLLTGRDEYLDGAVSNIDYLTGRNGTGYSFITGIGEKTPMHPHHRPSVADNVVDPVPGLLVGGPNPGQQDKVAYPTKEPELSYVDNDKAYACNEIAINWNAPAVYLINAVQAVYDKKLK